jgi:hypothetical protein
MTTVAPASPSPYPNSETATAVSPSTAPQPITPTAQTDGASVWVGVLLSAAVVAAILTAAVNTALARRKTLEEERSRLRTTFAEAFETAMRYKEMPYAIRRRRDDEAGAERVRLSDELRRVQERLSYFSVWIAGESTDVGKSFEALVDALRRVAGSACHDAWMSEPAQTDEAMNIGRDEVDLTELRVYEDDFMAAARRHLDGFVKIRRIIALPQRLKPKHAAHESESSIGTAP